MHIIILFTIYASYFFTLFTCITHTFSCSDFQPCILCIYHHNTLLIITHYTAYHIDYPQSFNNDKSTCTTEIMPHNHTTNTAMFSELLRSLSACFILTFPPIFSHISHSFTARFQFKGYTVHQITATISRHYCFHAPDIFPFIRFFIRSSFTLTKSHRFSNTCTNTRATL